MKHTLLDRRGFVKSGAALVAGTALVTNATASEVANAPIKKSYQKGRSPWPICLDTATIRPATLEDKIKIASKAGYDAIEPWDSELEEYEKKGGDLKDLGKRIKDAGLFVPSVIGLWDCIPTTQAAWEASLPLTRNRMRMASSIGAQHVQAIPGDWNKDASQHDNYNYKWASDRYRDLLEIGLKEYNINPALVFVNFLPACRRIGQAAAIAIDANHPKAKIIPDVFHMYIADSGFEGMKLLNGDIIAIFQFNDAPASPSKELLKDEHRVYPGDGILPLVQSLKDLIYTGFKGCISLELYNPNYWNENLQKVAETGLEKTLTVIGKAVN